MIPSIDTNILTRLRLSLPRLAPFLQDNVPLRQLALDSMDTLELLCAVEDEFGVALKEDEFQPQHCLQDLAHTIALKSQPTLS
jgi:acyl carrier protein